MPYSAVLPGTVLSCELFKNLYWCQVEVMSSFQNVGKIELIKMREEEIDEMQKNSSLHGSAEKQLKGPPFYRGWTAASRTRVDSMPSRAVSRLSLEISVTSTTSVPCLIWMGF